jgi:TatD DNase family protein
MIDSHCHLADKQFATDLDAVLKRAKEAGVDHLITIADSLEEAEACVMIAEKHPHIFCTVGVHPHHAKDWKRGDGERIKEMVGGSRKVRAVGEIGLDYHYDHSPRGTQRAVFLEQLTLSRELGLPAVIHCREAVKDIETIVKEVEPLQAVMHCCTEKWGDVEWFVELGHMLSFTGIATYPASHDIRDTVKHCPLSQIMIETDAPYLAPVPHRGKRNEPAYVVEVAREIAKIKGLSIKEVDEATTKNAVEFFGLAL